MSNTSQRNLELHSIGFIFRQIIDVIRLESEGLRAVDFVAADGVCDDGREAFRLRGLETGSIRRAM